MVSDDGEHTRFPCLATVRSLVATVVTVLAFAVVVLVIAVVDRPEDISLSISHGYIQSQQQWWTEKTVPMENADPLPIGLSKGRRPRAASEATYSDVSGSFGAPKVVTRYEPATPPVNLRVTWNAYNPSGRGLIECNVTAIRVFDMPSASSKGMEIGRISFMEKPIRFSVPPQASHTETQWVAINDTDTLLYIYDHYEGMSSFSAMVQVTATSTSKTPLSSATDDSVTYYCLQVNVVHGTPDGTAYSKVTCTTEYPVPISSPAPAPVAAAG